MSPSEVSSSDASLTNRRSQTDSKLTLLVFIVFFFALALAALWML